LLRFNAFPKVFAPLFHSETYEKWIWLLLSFNAFLKVEKVEKNPDCFLAPPFLKVEKVEQNPDCFLAPPFPKVDKVE
jgi:hypothetical protein